MKTQNPSSVASTTLYLVIIAMLLACSGKGVKNQPAEALANTKRTLAELWYKTGGHFENGKYIGGGSFQKFDSLWVPAGCTDHSFFMKYEGPGWESDKVAYRLYLDWRNAIDVFGKKVDTIVLPNVGQDGYESYHEMSVWGQDVLKVGESLGIGTFAFWDGNHAQRVAKTDSVFCRIAEDGDLQSQIQINYYGWKIDNQSIDLKTSLTINAGSRLTKYVISMDKPLPNVCTGIVKLDETVLLKSKDAGKWSYLATWGKQSLANDSLGLAVLYKTDPAIKITEDEHSHVIIFSTGRQQLTYYFLAAWEGEKDGIKTKTAFETYLESEVVRLDKEQE
jgi:hypothetical protein